MKFEELSIKGLILITPDIFPDDRGFFLESYNKKIFLENGIDVDFVQDNHSRSSKGVLRGLHFQRPPFAQDKLIRVTQGEVYDVVVDLRKSSGTYGKWEGVRLSEDNKQMLFIPQGFAHGFLVLSDTVDFQYKVSNYYSKEHDGGVLWNDPDIGINWPLDDVILSEKDKNQPRLADLEDIF